jgi:hypothetical protein
MATQDSRILIKRSTTTGVVPTIPASNDHTDGTWIATDIYKGELFFNQADGIMFSRDDSGIVTVGGKSDSALYSASLTIASADVLQLNSTPKQFGISVPSGYAARIISLDGKIVYGSSTYATNGNLLVRCVGTSSPQGGWTGTQFLFATTSRTSTATLTSGTSATSNQLIDGADLEVFVSTGNPTAGDSDITVYVTYRIITL